jgi:hypothetical protein
MRTTQGQAAFGHNVRTIITYTYMVKAFSNKYRWTRILQCASNALHPECKHPQIIANEISKPMAQPKRVSGHQVLLCSSNNGWDFRRKFAYDGTSPSQNKETVTRGTMFGHRLNGSPLLRAPSWHASVIVLTNGYKSRR